MNPLRQEFHGAGSAPGALSRDQPFDAGKGGHAVGPCDELHYRQEESDGSDVQPPTLRFSKRLKEPQ
ncbi:MAG: hypothetical protein NTNFB01_24530 [Nitrospira sp.]